MKRPIFFWQKTLSKLGRRVVWRNHQSKGLNARKLAERSTKRHPTCESLEPRHCWQDFQLHLHLSLPQAPNGSRPSLKRRSMQDRNMGPLSFRDSSMPNIEIAMLLLGFPYLSVVVFNLRIYRVTKWFQPRASGGSLPIRSVIFQVSQLAG